MARDAGGHVFEADTSRAISPGGSGAQTYDIASGKAINAMAEQFAWSESALSEATEIAAEEVQQKEDCG
jgi:hypothetical protein